MALNIAPLLIHNDAVPGPAREALRAASTAPPESRDRELESAARLLYSQTDLDCRDVRELVGLPARSAAAADTNVALGPDQGC